MMNSVKMVVLGDIIMLNNRKFTLNDLYTKDFYLLSNHVVKQYVNSTFYVNELFLYIIQDYIAFEKFIIDNNVYSIDLTESSNKLYFLIKDIAVKNKITLIEPSLKKEKIIIKTFFNFYSQVLLSAAFLFFCLLRIPFVKTNAKLEVVSINRTKSSRMKIESLNINSEFETLFHKDSVYKYFPRKKRLLWVFKGLKRTFLDIKLVKNFLRDYVGQNSIFLFYVFYGKRLVHTNLYYLMLNEFFLIFNVKKFYTGNNLDRYAIIEEKLSRKYKVNLICIPHGLEYGFKLPHCFVGDKFFSTSKRAAEHFNKLYLVDKFKFNDAINEKIYKKRVLVKSKKEIVFFTEPRELDVNHRIILELYPKLKDLGLELCLQIHPQDDKKEYIGYGLKIFNNFDEAINNNVCFARKSTVLLEALYNNSDSAAIILNEKDSNIFLSFPSLQTEDIAVCSSIEELFRWIIINLNKKEIND